MDIKALGMKPATNKSNGSRLDKRLWERLELREPRPAAPDGSAVCSVKEVRGHCVVIPFGTVPPVPNRLPSDCWCAAIGILPTQLPGNGLRRRWFRLL
jgi:hypothetical protein